MSIELPVVPVLLAAVRAGRFWVAVPLLLLANACSSGDGDAASSCDVPFVLARISGVGGLDRDSDVFSASARLEPLDRLTTDKKSREPRISPDGDRIAYGSDHTAVFVMGIDGKNPRQVSHGDADTAPDWSPDGEHIVFQRSDTELVVVSLADEAERAIGDGMSPLWSPAGDLIAFTVYDDVERFSLWVARPDGSERRPVIATGGPTTGGPVAWSPDGARLAFTAIDDTSLQFVVNTVDVTSGDVVEVPGSRSKVSEVITWTNTNNLFFIRNIRGPAVEIVTSKSATSRSPERVATTTEDIYNLRASDNPACEP